MTVRVTEPAETPLPEQPEATASWIDWASSERASSVVMGVAATQLASRGRARVAREVKASIEPEFGVG